MTQKNYEQLISDRIFFGGINAIEDLLSNEKIDVIYDLRAEVRGPLSNEVSVHQPIVDDLDHQDSSIKEAIQHIVADYNAGKNIYFHCNTGRGRAGTIATATLLELGKADTVEEAEHLVKEIRPQTNVKPPFKEALHRIYNK